MDDKKLEIPWLTLNTGYKIPLVILGTYKITGQEDIDLAINTALDAGYRGFDTAKYYKNEAEIGNALEVFFLSFDDRKKIKLRNFCPNTNLNEKIFLLLRSFSHPLRIQRLK